MYFHKNLQAELEGRYHRLLAADYRFIDSEVSYLCQFVGATPALRALTTLLETAIPDLNPIEWIEGHVTKGGLEWPPSEEGRAKVAWAVIRDWATGRFEMHQIGRWFSWATNINAMRRDVVEGLLKPFIQYLLDRLGTESNILYLLERFRRRLEWFEGERLYRQYLDAKELGQQGEKIYERDLHQYLFDQGIDYPFAQPRAAEGRADLVAALETDDPLVCEVKLFDGEKYGASYLSQGVRQALTYARAYGKAAGHVVVFNLTEDPLQVPSDSDSRSWPPRLHVAGRTIFLVVVQAKPLPGPSKQGSLHSRVLTRDDLVKDTE